MRLPPSARAAATPKMSTGREPGELKALRSSVSAAYGNTQGARLLHPSSHTAKHTTDTIKSAAFLHDMISSDLHYITNVSGIGCSVTALLHS